MATRAIPNISGSGRRRRPSKQHDVVDDIMNRVSSHQNLVDADVAKQVRQSLRVLGTKIKLGQLGKQDSLESRAAVVLEYALRKDNSNKTTRLSKKALASVVGMKEAAFESLHMKIGNYLEDSVSSTSRRGLSRSHRVGQGAPLHGQPLVNGKSSASKRPQLATSTNPPAKRALRSRSTWVSTIPALSIRLGSLVHDSHGFASQAETALQRLKNTVSLLPTYERNDYLYDMERHRAAYEAACFFFVASKSSGHSTSGNNNKSHSASAGHREDSFEDGTGGGEDRQLEKQHVTDAANISWALFNQILKTVEKLLSENTDKTNARDGLNIEKNQQNMNQKRSMVDKSMTSDETSNRTALSILERTSQERGETTAGQQLDFTMVDKDDRIDHAYSEAFLIWKDKTIREACERVRQKRRAKGKANISDAEALERSADNIVRRHQWRSVQVME